MLIQLFSDVQQDLVCNLTHHIHSELYEHDVYKSEQCNKCSNCQKPSDILVCNMYVDRVFDQERAYKADTYCDRKRYYYRYDFFDMRS